MEGIMNPSWQLDFDRDIIAGSEPCFVARGFCSTLSGQPKVTAQPITTQTIANNIRGMSSRSAHLDKVVFHHLNMQLPS